MSEAKTTTETTQSPKVDTFRICTTYTMKEGTSVSNQPPSPEFQHLPLDPHVSTVPETLVPRRRTGTSSDIDLIIKEKVILIKSLEVATRFGSA